jgi:hypothetical protein
MYEQLCITISCIGNKLKTVSLIVHDDGEAETTEHGEVPKTTAADDIRQELVLLTIILNKQVRKFECAIVGFHIDFKPSMIIATYLLRPH